MILAMNIGNTHFSMGFKENDCADTIRLPSETFTSQVDFVQAISRSMAQTGRENVNGAILASVDPELTDYLMDAVKELFGFSPLLVHPGMNMKLDLSSYNTALIGSDRIAVCEAAISKYSTPIIVFDFGTATTINTIDRSGCFLGGSILPGLTMGLHALVKDTAQLPQSEISTPKTLIGRDTQGCLTSGAIFGNAAMLDGMVQRIESLLGQKAAVLATGGNADGIIPFCQTKVIHEPELLMAGLYDLYEKNISPLDKGIQIVT